MGGPGCTFLMDLLFKALMAFTGFRHDGHLQLSTLCDMYTFLEYCSLVFDKLYHKSITKILCPFSAGLAIGVSRVCVN